MKKKYVKSFNSFAKMNETIDRNEFKMFKDTKPAFVYNTMEDFENALKEYDGSFDSSAKPWGDVIEIDNEKYILSEYGEGYMIFEHIDKDYDYFTVKYDPVTSNFGKPTLPFRFYGIE